MRKLKYLSICLLSTLALTACEDDPTVINPDPGNDESTMDVGVASKPSTLNSSYHSGTEVVLFNFQNNQTELEDDVYIVLAKPATQDLEFRISVDPDFEKNTAIGNIFESQYKLCKPEIIASLVWNQCTEFSNDGIAVIKKGENKSSAIKIKAAKQVNVGGFGVYALPLIAKCNDSDFNCTLWYLLENYDFTWHDRSEKDHLQVVYVNTESVNPLIVTGIECYLNHLIKKGNTEIVYEHVPAIDIVNLRPAQITYDKISAKVSFKLSNDLAYVLKHADKYIRPLQRDGFKVCISIEGSGSGIGFANLTNDQINDFATQVQTIMDMYQLDGINLRDEFVNYGIEGMPEINNESYPLLIKAIREKLPDKLLTLADDGGTTSTMNVEHAGIKVGEYIDYAWSTDWDNIVDPWLSDSNRNPIIGLDRSKYGSIAMAAKSSLSVAEINAFTEKGRNAILVNGSAKIFVQDDMCTNDYGYENARYGTLTNTMPMLYEKKKVTQYPRYSGGIKSVTNFVDNGFYYGFKKDW